MAHRFRRVYKKSLILSGLQKPIFVVGYSPNLGQFVAIHSKKAVEQQAVRPFTFLHVSSCFPLKGVIGTFASICQDV